MVEYLKILFRFTLLLLSISIVINCGGGGGGGGNNSNEGNVTNSIPTANAGIDQNVSTGSLVVLNGYGSDVDGNNLTYSWSFVSRPSGSVAVLSGDSTSTPSFIADLPGLYVIRLIVNDGQTNSTADEVTINSATFSLPDSGQTLSYTSTYGEDSDYIINAPSFSDNGNGTITDNATRIMWQKDDDGITKTWSDAIIYCNNMSLAGYSDWQLPSKKELRSIINYGLSMPMINTTYFHNPQNGNYWSRSIWRSIKAFAVSFSDGNDDAYDMSISFYLRCNRGGQYPSNNFTNNLDGTVTDNNTGLMWQNSSNLPAANWEGAINNCENLVYAGYSNWRLPNVKELDSVSEYFQDPYHTWSSTINPAVGFGSAYRMDSDYYNSDVYGFIGYIGTDFVLSVRCVRSL